MNLRGARGQRLARVFQRRPDQRRLGMRIAEYALPRPCDRLKRLHGFSDIGERGPIIAVESVRVKPPHFERDNIILSESAARHGCRFSQQRLGFLEALQ